MNAQFSEFTYGFSLVSELAKTLACTAVPIFPSLIEEGKMGGGYDAKLLSKKGTILNLQFKLKFEPPSYEALVDLPIVTRQPINLWPSMCILHPRALNLGA